MSASVLIANCLTFTGSIILTLSGLIKDKKRFLTAQCFMTALFTAGNVILGGYTGAIVNALNLLRNILGVKEKFKGWVKIAFIAVQIALTAIIGTDSIIMWLPVIGNVVFTWFMETKDMVLLKSVNGGAQLMWAIYDFSIKNYAGFPFDIAAMITSAISVIQLKKEHKKNAA